MLKVLSICTSAGLLDKVFVEQGFDVVAGCELMPHKRELYAHYVGGDFLCHDIRDLPGIVAGRKFDLVIGGVPCQANSKLRAVTKPKFPDLTNEAKAVLDSIECRAFIFENVVPLEIDGAVTTLRNAMNYPEMFKGRLIHQNRPRWFTHSANIIPPVEDKNDDIFPYPAVVGKHYSAERGAILQGHPEFARIKYKYEAKREALADAVPRGLAEAWARQAKKSLILMRG
ncbi:DNA cytosine methyltransferase [Vibrio metschnikovii]|uniref:DNA cytosine methyltransferase n=1 Tax=Vibrio metschnikovii TaxID=28172 RepID=UPI002FC95067